MCVTSYLEGHSARLQQARVCEHPSKTPCPVLLLGHLTRPSGRGSHGKAGRLGPGQGGVGLGEAGLGCGAVTLGWGLADQWSLMSLKQLA